MQKDVQWFSNWFNTEYYHTLYKHRNDDEAKSFIKHLTEFLNLKPNAKILDLPCGKGRHSVELNSLGFNVLGADLSENSINSVKHLESETLKFKVHDMREELNDEFDAVFNLFSSFGYFNDDDENLKTIQSISKTLPKDGVFVLDFLNMEYILKTLVTEEVKIIDNIVFNLKRYVDDGFLIKDIQFFADNEQHHYQEKIKVLTQYDFKHYFEKSNFEIINTFGDYKLNDYKDNSQRLIFICKKL